MHERLGRRRALRKRWIKWCSLRRKENVKSSVRPGIAEFGVGGRFLRDNYSDGYSSVGFKIRESSLLLQRVKRVGNGVLV